MRKISSRLTFWYRRVFPVFWFGFLALWTMFATLWPGRGHPPLFVLFFPAVMALAGYLMMRRLLFPLADEVFLDGDEVIVRKNGKEIRFDVRQIINVDSSTLRSPQRITLTLRKPSELGREILFCPKYRFLLFSRHPTAEELIAKSNGLEWTGSC
jgi:hypothetical protein